MCIFGAAAVAASAVRAGIIASSSGSASVAPTPRSTVRRDRCFFVTNMCVSYCCAAAACVSSSPSAPGIVLKRNGSLSAIAVRIAENL